MKAMETQRLLLRPFALDDAQALHREIYSDMEVLQWYSGSGVQTLAQVQQRLADHAATWREDELGRLAVLRQEDGALIGQVHTDVYRHSGDHWWAGVWSPFDTLEVELAFAFGRRFWGQSYAFEACQAVVQHVFADLRLPRLVGGAMEPNLRSANLQRRLGYRVERNPHDSSWRTVLHNTLL